VSINIVWSVFGVRNDENEMLICFLVIFISNIVRLVCCLWRIINDDDNDDDDNISVIETDWPTRHIKGLSIRYVTFVVTVFYQAF